MASFPADLNFVYASFLFPSLIISDLKNDHKKDVYCFAKITGLVIYRQTVSNIQYSPTILNRQNKLLSSYTRLSILGSDGLAKYEVYSENDEVSVLRES